ncbi:hypothetical protein BN7_5482 [Wickerhamomyces ciferrii]|uniref:Uncharacterized protein n=1 Tax=Wickerhamomyces ciferrii (strain ATCC 14091 / BCRC 22168 / CBS 111 / JCM 3599 / NBRC 0793 / NRRL Y-1031 F-60-10) TaxID=1206466 RepID=K0KKZ3_WICCF|nr:uncharacterized protein BN7_5482 [Wickerhamomyces ciferrii]CCH45895.1 hypothetical protein BN7_5482 [Wickerhamomyces ciferrii]
MSKLVVLGGNGFLGRRICQAGINAGFQVTSLSRSGKPPKLTPLENKTWIEKVDWKSADIFQPNSYKDELKDAKSVIHSLGILLENQNYKSSINSNSSILNEFSNFLKPSNPLTKTSFNSYESINRDSAVLLAETFQETTTSSNPSFVYISADKGFPGLPKGYINSKREAEQELSSLSNLRSIFIRPGFMFDEVSNQDNLRTSIKKFVDLANWGNQSCLGGKIPILNEFIRPTISTQRVAQAIIYRIQDPDFNGVVSLEDLLEK